MIFRRSLFHRQVDRLRISDCDDDGGGDNDHHDHHDGIDDDDLQTKLEAEEVGEEDMSERPLEEEDYDIMRMDLDY